MPVYDFNVPFTDVNGQPNGKKVSEALKEFVGSQAVGKEDTILSLHWYSELKKGDTLELDEISKKKLVELIMNSQMTFVYVKDQYLNILEPKV